MGLFREPWVIVLIIVLVLLLFAGPKLPAFAKSLGQSMRVFRKEVKSMKDDQTAEAATTAVPAATTASETPAPVPVAKVADDAKPEN